MTYATPFGLVAGLARHESAARGFLEKRYDKDMEKLIAKHHLKSSMEATKERVFSYLKAWLIGQTPQKFIDVDWLYFDARVFVRCDRLLSVTSTGKSQNAKQIDFHVPESNGEISCGTMHILWFHKSKEMLGGDWWAYEPIDRHKLLVFVADVSGHSQIEFLLTVGLDSLWRMTLAAAGSMNYEPSELMSFMDRELEFALPEGAFVQATLARFDTHVAGAADICPRDVASCATKSQQWIVPSGGQALGLLIPADQSSLPFPKNSQLIIATDGLGEQPTGEVGHCLKSTIDDLLNSLPAGKSLYEEVVASWVCAVATCGEQHDDVCIVTVQHRGK